MPIGAFRVGSMGGGKGRPYVVDTQNGSTASAVLTLARPDDAAVGDWLFAGMVRGVGLATGPVGWTLVGKTSGDYQAVWRYRLAAGDPSSWDWSFGSSSAVNAIMVAVRDADPTSPVVDSAAANISFFGTEARTLPPVTAPSVPSVVLGFVTARGNVANYTMTSPLVELADHRTDTGVGAIAVGHEEEPPLSTVRTYTVHTNNLLGTNQSGGGITIAIR